MAAEYWRPPFQVEGMAKVVGKTSICPRSKAPSTSNRYFQSLTEYYHKTYENKVKVSIGLPEKLYFQI